METEERVECINDLSEFVVLIKQCAVFDLERKT